MGVAGVSLAELWALEPAAFAPLGRVHGLLFLFKWASGEREGASASRPAPPPLPPPPPPGDGRLFFAQQVIPHACATLALLHVLLNADSPSSPRASAEGVDAGPVLGGFRAFTEGMGAGLRGAALGQCDAIRVAHSRFARPEPFLHDETRRARASEEEDVFHFVAYVPRGGRVYELDGLAAAPVDHLGAAGGGDGSGGCSGGQWRRLQWRRRRRLRQWLDGGGRVRHPGAHRALQRRGDQVQLAGAVRRRLARCGRRAGPYPYRTPPPPPPPRSACAASRCVG